MVRFIRFPFRLVPTSDRTTLDTCALGSPRPGGGAFHQRQHALTLRDLVDRGAAEAGELLDVLRVPQDQLDVVPGAPRLLAVVECRVLPAAHGVDEDGDGERAETSRDQGAPAVVEDRARAAGRSDPGIPHFSDVGGV